ncbi:MAG: ribosome small subunit-dependent GTPase A [Planctomycetota bacterium]|nr:MAG: ribosome small subunit-dependent GTPase A [Planctomycetota bacterium]
MNGRIHKIAANDYEVHTEQGVLHCRFRGKLKRERQASLKLAAVGDFVDVVPGEASQGTIEKVLERRSRLSRHDVMRPSTEQVIVANVDVLFVVQAAKDPDFNDTIVDKCTVMAAGNRLPLVIVINKSDLDRPDVSIYEKAGYRCLRTSAKTGEGIDELRSFLKDKTSVFMGPSGVGKSSLINSLDPELALKVGEVSRRGEGRHTTTWVELLPIAGGLVADTPGMEFFTLWGVTPENLKDHFLDFVDLAGGCKFRNCSHTAETGCAVKGRVAESRYRNYLEILEKLREQRSVFGR